MPTLRPGVLSVTGRFRDNNEDSVYVDPGNRFVLVADGMGGQAAGERASSLAVEMIAEAIVGSVDFDGADEGEVAAALDAAVADTNEQIMELGKSKPEFHQMGTTVVFLIAAGGGLFVGNVGDSRAYRLAGDSLTQLTTDHSVTQALVDAGTITPDEARTHSYRNVLYRYLGTQEGSKPVEPQRIEAAAGERFVLCSDGVTDGIGPDQIRDLLEQHDEPDKAAQEIVRAAEEGGSRDNITCAVVIVDA
ncbi:MAG: protein phosphatase 2C domain-containing protein [Planctomycetota bacterium]